MTIKDLTDSFDESIAFQIVRRAKGYRKSEFIKDDPDNLTDYDFVVFSGNKNDFNCSQYSKFEQKITNAEFKLKMLKNRELVRSYLVEEITSGPTGYDMTIAVKDPEHHLSNLTNFA